MLQMVRREELNLWQELFPTLVSLSYKGPIQVNIFPPCSLSVGKCLLLTPQSLSVCMHRCGFLLSSPDFRLHACEFFKLVSQRKRPIDDTYAPEFDSAMSNIFQILMNVSKDFLYRSSPSTRVIDESDIEFAEYICESMLSLGSTNLHCIAGDSAVLPLYLQQMLGFFQHFKAALHLQSLTFSLALMRDLMSKPKAVAHSAGDGSDPVDIEKRKILIFLNDDICSAILDVSFQHMLKREKVIHGIAFSLGHLELWSDDVEDKGTFGQYRSKLVSSS
ncbi:protein HASTY 1-like [Malus domestica]|uniref:protein HASTY 1-like n=1 Tax=Malus domestica TaxID=3750 RepID=UPI0039750AB7